MQDCTQREKPHQNYTNIEFRIQINDIEEMEYGAHNGYGVRVSICMRQIQDDTNQHGLIFKRSYISLQKAFNEMYPDVR